MLYCDTMKTATVRDLRYDFPKIEAWLRAGEEIQITKRSKPLGRVIPESRASKKKKLPPPPDFAARRNRIFKDRVFTQAEIDEARAFETGEP
jgi:antitoxin (DNA-binding transcriptional repressor) of toxin-antitoxin stability system